MTRWIIGFSVLTLVVGLRSNSTVAMESGDDWERVAKDLNYFVEDWDSERPEKCIVELNNPMWDIYSYDKKRDGISGGKYWYGYEDMVEGAFLSAIKSQWKCPAMLMLFTHPKTDDCLGKIFRFTFEATYLENQMTVTVTNWIREKVSKSLRTVPLEFGQKYAYDKGKPQGFGDKDTITRRVYMAHVSEAALFHGRECRDARQAICKHPFQFLADKPDTKVVFWSGHEHRIPGKAYTCER